MESEHSSDGDVEPNLALKRKTISSKHKAAKRVFKRLRTLEAAKEPMLFSLQALTSMEEELETLVRRARRCNDVLLDEELDAGLLEADEVAYLAFEETIDHANQMCQEMMVLKASNCLSSEISTSIRVIQQQILDHPDMDNSEYNKSISKLVDEMADQLRGSTLPLDHHLREELEQHKASLAALLSTSKESKPTVIMRGESRDHDLPKTSIKRFTGGLAEWHAFWGRFSGAVHNNPSIKESKKLALLTDLVADPALHEFMVTVNDGEPGRYEEAVQYLTSRFDRPRELHAIHSIAIASLLPIKGSPSELSATADSLHAAISGLRRSGYTSIDHMATSLAVSVLPNSLRQLWENKTEEVEGVPNVDMFISFLRKKATMADKSQKSGASFTPQVKRPQPHDAKREKPRGRNHEGRAYVATPQVEPEPQQQQRPAQQQQPKHQARGQSRHNNNNSSHTPNPCTVSCKLCSQLHYVFSCKVFRDMGVVARKQHVQSNSLCENCLKPHQTSNCTSTYRCKVCQSNHNTLLHVDTAAVVHHISGNAPSVSDRNGLMMTSQVRLTGPGGEQAVVTAMLDTGADVPVLASRVVGQLRLKPLREHIMLAGVGECAIPTPSPTAWVTVQSMHSDWSKRVKVTILPRVTTDMPRQNIQEVKELPHIRDLVPLADPAFHLPKRIDLILDVDCLDDVLLPNKISGPKGTPSAWSTLLGWGIMGRYSPEQNTALRHSVSVATSATMEEVGLDSQLQRFWSQEAMVVGARAFSTREKAVELHFSSTHQYFPERQRYMVSLPRQEGSLQLGESRATVARRFLANEASLIRKGTLDQFQSVMQEYLDLGHAQKVTPQELGLASSECYYLPIHAVYKKTSSTTKLRIVFDASCSTSTGVSLNDLLASGPTLHPQLDTILMRFRTYRVAVTADISKMYREVELCPADQQLHRFLWRPDQSQPIGDYHMNRVTFGVTSSPYVAVKVLQQTADDHGHPTSLAHHHIYHSFYVDDLLAGADDSESAFQLHQELRRVLAKGGFELRKWRSSSSALLRKIPEDLKETVPAKEMVDAHSAAYPKALGIAWDSRKDELAVQVQLPDQFISTKRGVASDTAKSFDVLGWLSPFMLHMKVLFQSMWKEKINWDTPLKEGLVAQHVWWRKELPLLKHITVPRCYYPGKTKPKHTELQGFSDASEAAYSAVVYVRAVYEDGSVSSTLVVAKTKVAPLKRVSITRLELCGAVLLTELMEAAGIALDIPRTNRHGWCDNTSAICWLKGCPSRWKTYVGNRVSLASDYLAPEQWEYVPTLHNPADCASRGLSATELINHPLWWHGPSWLLQTPVRTPSSPPAELDEQAIRAEERETVVLTITTLPAAGGWESRYNCYTKLIRGTALAFSFCRLLLSTRPGRTRLQPEPLTVLQLTEAETYLYTQSQQRTFSEELQRLKASQPVRQSSKLKALNPFINSQGLLCVGGRLSKSLCVTSLQAQPPILCYSDHLTILIFQHYHVCEGHCGPTALLARLSTCVYVVSARCLARSVCASCVTCRRRAPKPLVQQMGDLPAHRVNPALCFINTGLDYAGPIKIKRGNPRRPSITKGYLAIFVCLATKAIHIEVVSDQSTPALIAALKRFCSIRGLPRNIYSDNGSNFVGARHCLHDLYSFLQLPSTGEALRSSLMQDRISWHTIPQRAPHFGGIWEAAVKSCKHHLKRIVGGVMLYFEELVTITHQISACLNSRPYLAIDCQEPGGELPLTPGHFLAGRPLRAYPEEPEGADLSLTNRWRLCTAIVQEFWDSWSKTYLTSLQKRNKWTKPTPNLSPGDLVMMLDEQNPSSNPHQRISTWKMGRVVAIHPGSDGLVRAASVEVAYAKFPNYYHATNRTLDPKDVTVRKAIYDRPIVKLSRIMAYKKDCVRVSHGGEDVSASLSAPTLQ